MKEFDSKEAAEESVAKYHEGFFMGNKIRVELSHGGGRTAKYTGDPGACFKCGQMGHWARSVDFFSLLTLQIVDLCGLSGNVLIKRLQGDICLFHFFTSH